MIELPIELRHFSFHDGIRVFLSGFASQLGDSADIVSIHLQIAANILLLHDVRLFKRCIERCKLLIHLCKLLIKRMQMLIKRMQMFVLPDGVQENE